MRTDVLGRTNQAFPPVWLSLSAPQVAPQDGWAGPLVEAALATGAPLDITAQPALWGGMMRGTDATLSIILDAGIDRAYSAAHAGDLIQASFVQFLSAIGRESVDFFFLRIRSAREEFQTNGALEMLESLRQEGHLRFLGLAVAGSALAARSLWQFHDAFDVILFPQHPRSSAGPSLTPLAQERRVGVVGAQPLNWGYGVPVTALPPALDALGLDAPTAAAHLIARAAAEHPVMVGVKTPEEVSAAVAAGAAPPSPLPDWDARLAAAAAVYDQPDTWHPLLTSPDPALRRGAGLALAQLGAAP